MVTRFCVVCGTEVEESAAFCPSCGNPLEGPPPDEIPAAPAWPEPEPSPEPAAEPGPAAEAEAVAAAATAPVAATSPEPEHDEAQPATDAPARDHGEPTRTWPASDEGDAEPPPAARPGPTAPATARAYSGDEPGRPSRNLAEQIDLPFTWPVMLSGWLIGIGSFVAALSVLLDFRSLGNPVTLIAFLLLLAVAATVFLAANMPAIPHRQLWVLVVSIGAFGAAFERIGAGTGFAGAVFFLGTLAAAIGALIGELGRDRPMGGPAA